MNDPAWGRSKAQRALGENLKPPSKKKKAPVKESRLNEFRVVHVGQYDGPKASYGRYNVGQQSADMLNRSKRNMDMR
jgi:hypothetical protein